MGKGFFRHLVLVLAVAVGVSALTAWPAHAWAGDEGIQALLVAAGLCVLGALLGRIPYGLLVRRDDDGSSVANAVQASMGVRVLATAALALPVFLTEALPRMPFAVWLGVHYLAQLGLEVFVSLREFGQNHRPAEGSGPKQMLEHESSGSVDPDGDAQQGAGKE